MIFFSPLQDCRILLLNRKIEGKRVFISMDSAGYLSAIIRSNNRLYSVAIQGIPKKVVDLTPDHLNWVKTLLNEECLIKPCGMSILIMLKLRGGGPPLGLEDCKDNPQQLAEIGVIPSLYGLIAGLELYSLTTGNKVTGAAATLLNLACNLFLNSQEEKKYTEKANDIQSLPTEETKLASVKDFFEKQLSNDLSKVKNLEQILSKKIEEAGTQDLSQFPQFLNSVATIYRYKDSKQSDSLLSISQEIGKIIPAALGLSATLPLTAKFGAIATILVGVISAGMTLKRFLIKDRENPLFDSTMKAVQDIVEKLRTKEKEGFERVERILGEVYVGLSRDLQDTNTRIGSIDSHLFYIKERIDITHNKIDRSFIQLLGFNFRQKKGTVMALVNTGIEEGKAKKYACTFLDWAAVQSKDAIFNGAINSQDPPRQALQEKDVEFNIGYLNIYLMRYFPKLAIDAVSNPLVWSEAAHAYMELRLSTRNFDKAYTQKHQEDFKSLVAVGISLQQYIGTIQQSTALFQQLLKNYLTEVQSLQKMVQKTKNLDTPECRDLFQKIDDAHALVRSFCYLAFSRSVKIDPYFIALLHSSSDYPHGLMKSIDIKNYCIQYGMGNFLHINEILSETAELLLQGIESKNKSIAEGKTTDDLIVVTMTLQKLNTFWKTVYSQEDVVPQELRQSKPAHCLDIVELCKGNLILSVKYGLVANVRNLVERGTSVDEATPALPTKRTPLHCAAMLGYEELVKYLLDNGATPIKRDEWGKTPVDLAKTSTIQSLLISSLRKRAPINALAVGKQFQHVLTSSESLPGQNVYTMRIFESRLVTQEYYATQIWDMQSGKCLKKLPRYTITEGNIVISTTTTRQSTIYDLRSNTLNAIPMEERAFERVYFRYEENQIINQKNIDAPLSIISAETGRIIDQINIDRGVLHNYCPNTGISPIDLRSSCIKPPFNDHPHCLLVRKALADTTFFEIWNLQTKKAVFSLDVGGIWRTGEPMVSVANNLLAVSYPHGHVKVFDMATKKVVHEVANSNSLSYACVAGNLFGLWKNKLVAMMNDRKQTKDFGIWNVDNGKLFYVFKDINHHSSYGYIKDGIVVFVDTGRNHVKLYDLEKEQELGIFQESGQIIRGAVLEGEIVILMTASNYGDPHSRLSFFHIYTGRCLQTLLTGCNFCLNGDTLATFNPATVKVNIWKLL